MILKAVDRSPATARRGLSTWMQGDKSDHPVMPYLQLGRRVMTEAKPMPQNKARMHVSSVRVGAVRTQTLSAVKMPTEMAYQSGGRPCFAPWINHAGTDAVKCQNKVLAKTPAHWVRLNVPETLFKTA